MKKHIMDSENRSPNWWQSIKWGLDLDAYTGNDALESLHLNRFSVILSGAIGFIVLSVLLGVFFSIWIPLKIVLAALIVIMVWLYVADIVESWHNARNPNGERVKETVKMK